MHEIVAGVALLPVTFAQLSPDDVVFTLVQWLYRSLADTAETNQYGCIIYPNSEPQETIRRRFVRLVLVAMLGGNGRVPRQQQVDTVHDLVFEQLDIVLIARTSFGKSLIIQAFSLITDRITILIAPLVKLAEEQGNSLLAIPRATPLLITSETRRYDKTMFKRIAAGAHSHIILGPEQLQTDQFHDAVKSPEFEKRCGLVAIDEAHLLPDWEIFRSEYTLIWNLRFTFPPYVHWFACTATASDKTLAKILQYGGFRQSNNHNHRGYLVDVRRYNVDRPEIYLGVFPIERGRLQSWEYLDYLISDAPIPPADRRQDQAHLLASIPKTIIYIDSKAKTSLARDHLVDALIRKGYSQREARLSVKFYHSVVPQGDQAEIYENFKLVTSRVRIAFSTVALGLGMDIPDVMRVVQWGIPRSYSLEDIWQRIGRSVRGYVSLNMLKHGQGVIFAPYWVFDQEGTLSSGDLEGALSTEPVLDNIDRSKRRPDLGALEIDVAPPESEDSDLDDNPAVPDQEEATGSAGIAGPVAALPTRKVRKWSKQELANRTKIGKTWHQLFNGCCIRNVILSTLNNEQATLTNDDILSPDGCCYTGTGI